MFVPFEAISPSSRIWIFQSDKKLSEKDCSAIRENLTEFTQRWMAHGQPLKASFDIRYNYFVILAADETFNSTSGCSIDDSVRAIKALQQRTGLDFFNRNLIAFLNNDQVFTVPLAELKQKYRDRIWNKETSSFNNLISTKSQLENDWIVPAGNTWLKRYVPPEIIAT